MRTGARYAALAGAVLSVLVAVGLLVYVAGLYGGKVLPTGSRTTVSVDAGSDDPGTVEGAYRSWFDSATAEALVAELAAGLEGSDWCAGWSIVQLDHGGFVGEVSDVGSNLGVGRSARDCGHWVELEVAYEYTRSSSSQEDNAVAEIESSDLRVANAFDQHPAYAISSSDLLHEDLGHNTDDIIANAVAGMPLVLAEAGEVDPLTVEPVEAPAADGTVTFADAEGEGGSDVWRDNRAWLVVGLVTAGLGLAVLLWAWARLPVHRAGLWAILRPGGLAAQGRAVNPRRLLKAGLARPTSSDPSEEDNSVAG